MNSRVTEIAAEATKTAPPVAAMTVASHGYTLQDWVWVATLVYIVLQVGWLLWRWWKAWRTDGWTPNGSE